MKLHITKRQKPIAALLFLSLITLILATWVAASGTMGDVEKTVFRVINAWPNALRLPFLVVTYSGSVYALGALTLLLIWRGYPRLALRIFAGGVTVFMVTQAMKLAVQRPRPGGLIDNVHVREKLIAGFGFPSTHTAMTTVMALLLVVWLPYKWRWLAVLWIVMVGLSRIYLGVHAPLDVVGGFAAGVFVVCLSLLVHGKLTFVRKITGLKLSDKS